MNVRITIPFSKICVDSFRTNNMKHYILSYDFNKKLNFFYSHYHSDHTTGLGKTWNKGKIYCTKTTGNLLINVLGLKKKKLINVIDVFKPISIDEYTVTFFPANHTPGSVIVLFEKGSDRYLHTGDFRFNYKKFVESGKYDYLYKRKINEVYLDTTYCHEGVSFPTQPKVLKLVGEICKKFEAYAPNKYLFLVGSYSIGKEKIAVNLSKKLKRKIYVSGKKYTLMKQLTEFRKNIWTTKKLETNIHLVSMGDVWWKKILEYEKNFPNYEGVIGFKPTCQPHPQLKANKCGKKGWVIQVPYSEHSSLKELREFLNFAKCEKIIPTVSSGNNIQTVELLRRKAMTFPEEISMSVPKKIIEVTKIGGNKISKYFSFSTPAEKRERRENKRGVFVKRKVINVDEIPSPRSVKKKVKLKKTFTPVKRNGPRGSIRKSKLLTPTTIRRSRKMKTKKRREGPRKKRKRRKKKDEVKDNTKITRYFHKKGKKKRRRDEKEVPRKLQKLM